VNDQHTPLAGVLARELQAYFRWAQRQRRRPYVLAAQCLTPEIGTRLFPSLRMVQYHLDKVLTKLDIASRTRSGASCPAAKCHWPIPC
jgi:hypothetical protein